VISTQYCWKKGRKHTKLPTSPPNVVLVATDHDRFDWKIVKEYANLIVDTRGIYEPDGKKVFRA